MPEANAIGQIAVIRSLGRAGYPVHVVNSDPAALGFKSRYAARTAVHPPYDDPKFLDWLKYYVATNSISAIVPSEAFLLAIRREFATYQPSMAVSDDESVVYGAMSKCDVMTSFAEAPAQERLLDNLPPSILYKEGDPFPSQKHLEKLGLPIFLKCDGTYGRTSGKSLIKRALTVNQAEEILKEFSATHSVVLVQGFVPGKRVVADFCIWNDEILCTSMMMSRHENPHYGGISTLRTIGWNQAIWDDAAKKLRRLKWNGCAMMEYRHDPSTGKFYFIEINARYWTGLHVELFAGIDIPRIQMDAFFGLPSSPLPDYPKQLWCRYTVPGETGYVISKLKDPNVAAWQKAWAVIEFFLLILQPGIKSDLFFPHDRKLYFLEWKRFFADLLQIPFRRLSKHRQQD